MQKVGRGKDIRRSTSLPSSRKEGKGLRAKNKHNNADCNAIRFRCDFPSTQVQVMLSRGWIQVVDPEDVTWQLWWCETNDVKQILDSGKLEPRQKIPHFRNHYELTRKNYLYRNLTRYRKLLAKSGKLQEAELCHSMPITFELPNEYRMFVEEYQKRLGTTWIVKPAGKSQGRGIFLFRKLKDLAEWKTKESTLQQAESSPGSFLVQKYVDDPYLLAGRKFDLRIYVLVTSFHPLKVWLAREGFARLSGELFDLRNIDDSRVHLTNMAIQLKAKENDDPSTREQFKQDCKWALIKVREYLVARHGTAAVEILLQRIAGVIMASLLAVQPVMMRGRNSFELYGYDILLNEKLVPWLLEVNASPALTATDSEDYRLKFDLIDDLLNVLDFEGRFTGRETRIGGFDLLWNDGPVWIASSDDNADTLDTTANNSRRLNIFLGARNDRVEQLRSLREKLNRIRQKRAQRNAEEQSRESSTQRS